MDWLIMFNKTFFLRCLVFTRVTRKSYAFMLCLIAFSKCLFLWCLETEFITFQLFVQMKCFMVIDKMALGFSLIPTLVTRKQRWAIVPLHLGSEVITKLWINISIHYEFVSISEVYKISKIILTLNLMCLTLSNY